MTDGIHANTIMLGDIKFHQHRQIDAAVADRWQENFKEDFLGDLTWQLADELGYQRNIGGDISRQIPRIVRRSREAHRLKRSSGRKSD